MDELCGPPGEPSPEEVAGEVARRLGENVPAQAHVRQVLVDSLEEAEAARGRLVAGEDFVTVSREVSRAPNAMDGGELGFFLQGSLPEDIDDVIFALEPGEFSEPVQGPSGYHVFQVLEVVPSGPPDREDIELAVRTELGEQGAREHTQRCVDRLADEIGVEVNSDKLWFPYEGKYAEDRSNA
jgi:peptidyl-prolyl cis-trans isomerase C